MVTYGPYGLVTFGHYGLVCSCMVPYCPIWSRMVLYCPLWSCLITYCHLWSPMVTYGYLWSPMVTYGLVTFGPLWPRMVPYGLVWFRIVLYGPVWSPTVTFGHLLLPMVTYSLHLLSIPYFYSWHSFLGQAGKFILILATSWQVTWGVFSDVVKCRFSCLWQASAWMPVLIHNTLHGSYRLTKVANNFLHLPSCYCGIKASLANNHRLLGITMSPSNFGQMVATKEDIRNQDRQLGK